MFEHKSERANCSCRSLEKSNESDSLSLLCTKIAIRFTKSEFPTLQNVKYRVLKFRMATRLSPSILLTYVYRVQSTEFEPLYMLQGIVESLPPFGQFLLLEEKILPMILARKMGCVKFSQTQKNAWNFYQCGLIFIQKLWIFWVDSP